VLPYHVEAKVYEHEGLVEEKVDVEKTQKIEQKVEKVFDDVPSLEVYLAPSLTTTPRPSCDECYEILALMLLLMKTSFKKRRIITVSAG